jgi:antitoxin (DNA-binding transcriptional repressor) of toxin-antitoxin stability system
LTRKYYDSEQNIRRLHTLQTLSIGELKSRFSEVLGLLREGQEIIVSYGKKKEKVAVLVPYNHYKAKPERQLGLLKGLGSCVIHEDFKIDDEEMLSS